MESKLNFLEVEKLNCQNDSGLKNNYKFNYIYNLLFLNYFNLYNLIKYQ